MASASRWLVVLVMVVHTVCLGGCPGEQEAVEVSAQHEVPPEEGRAMGWTITSGAFKDGAEMRRKYTGEGKDVSPPIDFGEVPMGATELALICVDPDAAGSEWTHWVLYGLAADTAELPEGLIAKSKINNPACLQGLNNWSELGYRGPMPPPGSGTHHYEFTVYALSGPTELEPGATRRELTQAMHGLIIDEATLTGTYSR